MTAVLQGCPGTSAAPWSSPEARLVLRADAPRDQWLAARRSGIGSSDASAVLGLNRWTSPYEVWADKRGLLPPDPGSDATELGNLLEPIIVGRWSEKAGIPIRKAGLMASRANPWQLASVDRLAACGGIVEAKSLSWRVAEEWEDGQTPDHAEVQVQHQLAVTGRSHAHVVGLQDGRTWLERLIVRDDALIPDMTKLEAELWQLVVDGVEPPIDGSAATTEALNARWPATAEVETVLPERAAGLVSLRAEALADVALSQTVADIAANELRALMGEATVGYLPGGDPDDPKRPKVTWRRNGTFASSRLVAERPDIARAVTVPRPAIDTALLKELHPDIYTAYRARVLRVPTV